MPAARAVRAQRLLLDCRSARESVSGADSRWTRHFLQVPLPPQVLSISTPKARATDRRSWPAAAEPRRPEGWKVTVKVAGAAAGAAPDVRSDRPLMSSTGRTPGRP